MLFGLFRRLLGARDGASRVEQVADHVWLSSEAKFRGIRKEFEQRSAAGASMIALVAHFPDVLEDLEHIAAEHTGRASVRAVLARQLSAGDTARLPPGESRVLDLIVAERHPLASEDDALLELARSLPFRCRIAYHVSLEDPVMEAFKVESIRALLDRLGATDEEAITHPLVTRSIRRAQERLEADAAGRSDAPSAAEWLQRNR